MSLTSLCVGLLATGDELTNGEILNTNGQFIAQTLYDEGITVGAHCICGDNVNDIDHAIRYLFESHDVIILTGGLGPTDDDCTRAALAAATHSELVFHAPSWQAILQRTGGDMDLNVAQQNKQQAYFPAGADVLPNPNGTAAGCRMQYKGKHIFMLPGPPGECRPMYRNYVLPDILQLNQHQQHHVSWRLFGIGESQLASDVTPMLKPFNIRPGYRWHYPYIDFKLHARVDADLKEASHALLPYLTQYIICTAQETASSELIQHLHDRQLTIQIQDDVTGGLLEHTLTTPVTRNKLDFKHQCQQPDISLKISGLVEYWQQNPTPINSEFTLHTTIGDTTQSSTHMVKIRNRHITRYVVEYTAHHLDQLLLKHVPTAR